MGSGAASVAAEAVGGLQYQRIEVLGAGGSSVLAVNPDGSLNASIIGTPNVNVSGSVFATLSGSGSVITVWKDSSVIARVTGSVVSLQGTTPWVMVGSVYGSGSVVAFQGTSPWAITSEGSIITVAQGSVGAVIIGGSIAATVTPPANQSVSGTVGASVIGNVNTTITSIATAGGFLRTVPATGATVQGVADLQVVQGASVTAIAAQGANIFTYIRSVQVTNFGSASVLVKFAGGLGSTLGWTIAPAGGGSNIVYPDGLKTGANAAFTASISGTASVLVSAQGFIAGI